MLGIGNEVYVFAWVFESYDFTLKNNAACALTENRVYVMAGT
jgi:hypothetical protein